MTQTFVTIPLEDWQRVVSLTKDSYGSEIIRRLPQAYGVNEINE